MLSKRAASLESEASSRASVATIRFKSTCEPVAMNIAIVNTPSTYVDVVNAP